MNSPRSDLAAIASAIWGRDWVSPLARCLGIGLRTAQRWAGGYIAVPAWVFDSPELMGAAANADEDLRARLKRVRAYLRRPRPYG